MVLWNKLRKIPNAVSPAYSSSCLIIREIIFSVDAAELNNIRTTLNMGSVLYNLMLELSV
jgi:hypothetical protein